jgi:cell surface protein SprA
MEPDKGSHRRDFKPSLPEEDNTLVASLDIEIDPNPADSAWVGVMTGFGGGGLDLTQCRFIELWVNDFKPDKADRGGKLRIDLGRIDEDFYEPDEDMWNDEDINGDGWNASREDTGLDLLKNEDECAACTENDDFSGDDFEAGRIDGRFTKINGTEANGLYDTEDLNRSNSLDMANSYFTCVIDLADDLPVLDIREDYPTYDGFNSVYHERDSWRWYRVYLNDFKIVAPYQVQPSLDRVTHLRVWVDDADAVFQQEGAQLVRRLQVTGLRFVN